MVILHLVSALDIVHGFCVLCLVNNIYLDWELLYLFADLISRGFTRGFTRFELFYIGDVIGMHVSIF